MYELTCMRSLLLFHICHLITVTLVTMALDVVTKTCSNLSPNELKGTVRHSHVLQCHCSISFLTCSSPHVMQILSLVLRRSGHHGRLFRTCTRKCWLRTWSTPWTRKLNKICKNVNDNTLLNDLHNLHASCLV